LNIKNFNLLKILRISKNFKPLLIFKCTRILIFKTLARTTLSNDADSWVIRTGERRLISAEIKFMREAVNTPFQGIAEMETL
jgi:hypothetical protein